MAKVGEAKTPTGHAVKGSFVDLAEVAEKVGVHTSTILRWVKQKKVNVTGYKDRRGYWVFRESDVATFVAYARSFRPAS